MKEEDPKKNEGRQRLEDFFRQDLAATVIDGPTCEEVAAYVDGSMDTADRAAFDEMLALDPALRAEVKDVRDLRESIRREAQPTRHRTLWVGLAAAAVLTALLFWHGAPPAGEPDATSPKPSPAPLLTLRDAGREVALRADGSLAGLPGLSLQTRADVILALRTGGLPELEALARLRGARSALMGAAGETGFNVIAPVATFVRSERPIFRWTPHPKARGYEVAVFSGLVKIASVRVSGAAEAPLPVSLERGRTYLWQVAALTPAGRLVAPKPPEAEARFRVLGAEAAAALDKALGAAGDSDLAAGVLLARAGVRDEAETHLARLAAENPGSPEARRLLELVRP